MKQTDGRRFYEKTACIYRQMKDFEHSHKKCHKINRIECSILQYLANKKEPTPFKELSKHIQISTTRMTQLTDSLVQKKYIVRMSNDKDRRVLLAQITEEGKKVAQKFQQKHIKVFEEVLSELPEDKRNAVMTALEKWKKFLEEQPKVTKKSKQA